LIYKAPSKAWVFASGTNHWSYGLGKPGVSDARIQRATANILDRFLQSAPPRATRPPTPSALAASATSSKAVDLTWSDNSSNETGFVIERSLDGTDWSRLTSLPPDSTTYRDTSVSTRTAYRYRVSATNKEGRSAYTNVATATTPPELSMFFEESFPGTNGTPWDSRHWKVDAGTTASMEVHSGAGRMSFRNVPEAGAKGVATMAEQADTDTVASFRFSSVAPRGFLYVFSRASGDWMLGYPRASYFVRITNDISDVQLWRSQAGVTTSLGSLAGVGSVTLAKQWLRFRVQGDSISVKVWTDGTAEPANWELTATDSNITGPGVLQVKWQRGSTATAGREVTLDDIKVSNGGG
jgi:hypothetical protein